MNVSCTRSSTSLSGAPAPARKRASARAWRLTSSAAACSSPSRHAAISALSGVSAATGCGWAIGSGVGRERAIDIKDLSLPLDRDRLRFERSFEIIRPYDERLAHLLARAARVFADKGYHPTTMRDLSAASGMSLAGMYYYVRGKEDLLALIQERCFTQVLEGARQSLATAGDPQERLQAFIRHHVSFFAHHMAEMKVLSHEASRRGVLAIKRRYVDLLESILKDAAPEQTRSDRSAATYILFGMMNWIYNWYDPAGEIDPGRLADLMTNIFLGGFVEAYPEAK